MVNQISVADIDVAGRLRPVDQEHAELLAVSIKETGLKHPIVIRPSVDGPKAYKLVVGGHRLAALQRLALRDLVVGEHVIIQDLNDDEARLAEIDENLIRHELNALDRAISFLERKRLYEKLYPETGHGKAPKAKSQTLRLFRERFSRATAKKLGLSERLVQLSVDLASRLDPQAVASLRGTKVENNQRELLAVAALQPQQQRDVAALIAAGEARTASQAKVASGFEEAVVVDPQARLYAILLDAWTKADKVTRENFLKATDLTFAPAKTAKK